MMVFLRSCSDDKGIAIPGPFGLESFCSESVVEMHNKRKL